ncbi:hypothetical protein UPYG_G00164350 [Umbra pygmaea]|uniref:Fibronectin type-III domain-containing protein n=1 Tax=Umbra pygmaea TaxID=75934 RepID=A0ABD0X895_UMBPY
MSSESKSVHSETTESVVDSGIYSLQSSEIPSNFSNCDICPETKILKFCDTCQASFCEKHVKSHYTDPVLRNHLLKDVDMLSEDELPPPVGIKLQSVMSDSVFLTWSPPECLTGPQQFRVTWECEGNQQSLSVTDGCELEINKLQPGQNYKFSVETEGVDGKKSRPVSTSVFTVATPKDLKTVNLTDNSFTLSWSEAQGMNNNPYGYFISYTCPGSNRASVHTPDCQKTFSGLKPGTEYNVSVSTVLNDGKQSEPVSMTICTEIPAPDKVNVDSVDTRAATVSWNQPHGTGGTQCKYQVSYCLRGTKPHIRNTSSTSIKLSELQPASEYYFSVCTVLENEKKSQPVSTTINTSKAEP